MTKARTVEVDWLHKYRYLFLLIMIVGVALTCWFLAGRPFLKAAAQDNKQNLLNGGWGYLPGVSQQSDGLHVSYLNRAIVRQNGSFGQENPSVNMYGTHLEASGDFTLRAELAGAMNGASFRIYDGVPVVQDEFRVEPKSLEVNFGDKNLTVGNWGGYVNQKLTQQPPSRRTSYPVTFLSRNELTIQRKGEKITIGFNGTEVASPAAVSLSGKSLWFGLSTNNTGESWILRHLEVEASPGVKVINTQNVAAYSKPPTNALQILAGSKRAGFTIGAATALGPLVSDEEYARVVLSGNFGQVTTENALKWQFIHPQPGIYDYREADALVEIAKKNNLAIHGHTLVFGEANPVWLQNLPMQTVAEKQQIKQIMTDHITQVVGRYKSSIYSWDVVNEPLADYDTVGGDSGLRKNLWYNALGESYIAAAFAAARQANPKAKLYINEFGLESDGDRWDTFIALMKKLKSQGVPVNGVGFQAHVYDADDMINPSTLRNHIRELAELGLTSRISEMDVYSEDGVAGQSRQYADVFGVCFTEPSCVSWSTWGVSDRYNLWRDETDRLQYGTDFLWDRNMQPTPAVSAIREMILR